MIIAPTSCYFVIRTEGEAAAHVVSEVSPAVSNDITTAVLVSADFQSDIQAVSFMDSATAHITAATPAVALETHTKYNPLYMPGGMSEVDDMLSSDSSGAMHFSGMSGNPYLFKTVEVKNGEEELLTARVEYRPFEIPAYSDIIKARERTVLN